MSQTSLSLSNLLPFLSGVSNHIPKPREDTLFSIAGRGHYENPTSDLLAYFMKPDAQHGFGPLFLRTFLECMEIESEVLHGLTFDQVKVEREAGTTEKNRIDILIEGRDWILMIENKIYHNLNNDLESYERLANDRGRYKMHKLFAILSPYGASSKLNRWKAVTYQKYCSLLKPYFPGGESGNSWSKWQVFAREFILHLETELYSTAMTKEQIEFAETNFAKLLQAKHLAEEYQKHLITSLCESLRESIGVRNVNVSDKGWAFTFSVDHWNGTFLSWSYDDAIFLRIYCANLSSAQQKIASEAFQQKRQSRTWKESSNRWNVWEICERYPTREEAEAEFIALGMVLNQIYPPLPVECSSEAG
jgi:hypothetical protein